ncbi:MAG: hypothetical protein RL092_1771 [Bacteroidota bacterium]|jgi:hypothetical protein
MKYVVLISRLLIGSYLIITGLVNANDLMGYSFRLISYYERLDLNFLVSTSVVQAGVFSLVAMTLGAMLILGMKIRMTLLLIAFVFLLDFTLLFFASNQYAESILHTHSKWINASICLVLLILCIYLILKSAQIKTRLSSTMQKVILTTFVLIVAIVPFYSYSFLPLVDFGNYRVGMDLKVISEEENRSFKCFDMDGNNSTKEVLEYRGNQFFLVVEDIKSSNPKAFNNCNLLAAESEKQGIPFYGIASNNSSEIEDFRHEVQAAYPFLRCDRQVLRSMIRSNPGLILLDGSTIVAKWHFNAVQSFSKVKKEFKLRSGGPSLIQ